jgi:hypothetical protein
MRQHLDDNEIYQFNFIQSRSRVYNTKYLLIGKHHNFPLPLNLFIPSSLTSQYIHYNMI